jgi:hypothetical protein
MTGGADSSSPIPNSPLLSPRTWSHNWPTPAWQCFISGTLIRFLLPNTETPWQKAEELGWKDHIALKVDSRNPYQYAPHGLTIVKVRLSLTFLIPICGINLLILNWIGLTGNRKPQYSTSLR